MRLTVRTKLYGGFGVAVVLLLLVSATAYVSLRTVTGKTSDVHMSALLDDAVMSMRIAMLESMDMESMALLGGESAELRSEFDETLSAFDDALAILTEFGGESLQARSEELELAHETFHDSVVTSFEMLEAGDIEGAKANSFGATDTAITNALQTLDDAESEVMAFGESALVGANSAKSLSTTLVIGISAVAVLVASTLAVLLSRGIVGPLSEARDALSTLAVGDLTASIEASSDDEIGEMVEAYGRLQSYLGEMASTAESIAEGDLTVEVQPLSEKDTFGNAFVGMVGRIHAVLSEAVGASGAMTEAKDRLMEIAEQASTATQEVAVSVGQVAEGSSTQAQSAGDANESVESLSTAIEQVAENAKAESVAIEEASGRSREVAEAVVAMAAQTQGAVEGSENAARAADEGATLVTNTVDGIDRIKQSIDAASTEISALGDRSSEIGRIVAVIEDIAAQTNLLALNAAIEAARAGDQGRGFAVVADEVRQLAERVADATKEIANLIGGVQSGVEASVNAMNDGAAEMDIGTRTAAEARDALERIQEASRGVAEQLGSIAEGVEQLERSGTTMAERLAEARQLSGETAGSAEAMQQPASVVSDAVTSIASVAEENSAAAEEVSASAEEMSAQVEEVTASTLELGRLANHLDEQLSRFRLANGPVETIEIDEMANSSESGEEELAA